MSRIRSIVVSALVVTLTFSSAAFGVAGVSAANQSAKNVPTLEIKKPVVKVPKQLENPEDPNKEVRIIVELQKEPAIESATRKGVIYKNLPDSTKDSLESAVTTDQKNVKKRLNVVAPGITYLENFTTVFNGFSATVKAGQAEKIASQAGVKAVYEATEYERPEVKPEMKYSKELVQAQQVWNDYGYKGEGMVVGVIDTGIDPSHKDMILTDNASGDITQAEVSELLGDGSLEAGKYYTAKVPFGYNYMDGNNTILDLGPEASMHGMHVAGTVGANGNEENGGIKGVAPEAQLLALKVFGNDPLYPSTYGDIYIKAIDDSIKLGADVINMSLGATAGFVDSTDPEQQAVERATNNGILVSISAGNSDMFGSGFFYPYAENQDYGLTGSPSVSEDSFGVASFENDMITAMSFGYSFNGTEAGHALYMLANDKDPRDLPAANYEVVDAGFGKPEDFAGKDFTGKFALISRGEINFVEKGKAAQAAGAIGAIVYNNTSGIISMASDPAITIPFMSTLQADGLAMKAALDAGQEVKIAFDGKYVETQNPTAGEMSDFTSWGPTPNLDFKPEITAPGGNIFSTLNNDGYGLMSGTSMAAPHVSGGTALVFQRIEELGLEGEERVQFAKNIMMNTANPVEFGEGQYVSPRRQGAGLMQLHDALSTDVVVTNKATGEGKVALKEITGNKYAFTLSAENYSDEAAEFAVDVNVQVDEVADGGGGLMVTAPNLFGSQNVSEAVSINAPETVTVPANGTVEIPVTVDVSAIDAELDKVFTNGYFVDGFITLTDENEQVTGNTELVVPYFGFNGEWDDANIFDYFAWDPMTFYGSTYLIDNEEFVLNGGTHIKGFDPTKFAFSPNGDGKQDSVQPVFSLIRNAKELEVNVLDESGKKLRTIRTEKELGKNYDSAEDVILSRNFAWDGKVAGKAVEDGNYQIQVRAVIDYPGAEWQSIEFPVIVDTAAPVAQATFNAETKTVEVASFTDNTAADRWEVFLNGTELTEDKATKEDESLAPATTSFTVSQELGKDDQLTAVFYDVAGNKTQVELGLPTPDAEEKEPVIFVESPEVLSAYNSKEVIVKGRVEDDSKIASLTINGETATQFDGTNFTHTLTFEDGSQYVSVKAVDEFGNEMEIRRQIMVDTQAAEITLVNVPKTVDLDTKEVEITYNVKDNFDQIRAYLYDSEIYAHELSTYGISNFNQDIKTTVPVTEVGANEYVLVVEDLTGHRTEAKFTITKEAAPAPEPDDGTTLKVKKDSFNLYVGDSETISVTQEKTTPRGSKRTTNVTSKATYQVADPAILTVNKGKITAKKAGTTTITVSYGNDKVVISVTVKEPVTVTTLSVNNDDLSVKQGRKAAIKVTQTTTTGNNRPVKQDVTKKAEFKVADIDIAEVKNGQITAKKKGTTVITVTYDGNETTIKLTVK